MKRVSEFLKNEALKPVRALKEAAILTLKLALLTLLRMILWSLFFCGPILIIAFLSFHWVTEKTKEELRSVKANASMSQAAVTDDYQPSRNWGLGSITHDLEFWIYEFRRLRR